MLTAAGLLLCLSALAKAHAYLTDSRVGDPFFGNRALLAALMQLEGLLGLWFTFGGGGRRAWWAALVTFSTFLGVALYFVATFRPSCGCFGQVPVRPWAMALLDAAFLCGLAGWPPRPWQPRPFALWTLFLIVNAVLLALWAQGVWQLGLAP